MYCRNCGKYIGTDDELCEECLHNDLVFGQEQKAASQPAVAPVNTAPTPPVSHTSVAQPNVQLRPDTKTIRMTGFGPALASTIVGVVAFIMVIVAFSLATSYGALQTVSNLDYVYGDGYYYTYSYDGAGLLAAAIIVFIIGLAMTVLSMVFGIKTLVKSVRTKRQYDVMPVPAFVLSIVGVVAAGVSCIWLFITMIILSAV